MILIEKFINGTEYAVEGWIYKKFIFGCLSKRIEQNRLIY